MNALKRMGAIALLMMQSGHALAEDVTLPAPVLEWSVYILLMFAACVAVGIAVYNRKNGDSETLGALLKNRHQVIRSVGPDTPVTDCVLRMNELRIGAMLVMDNEKLVGIFTERDAITRVLGAGLDPVSTTVSSVMTRDPITVPVSTSVEEAMNIVTTRRIRHLPVVREGKVVGLVSSGDLTSRFLQR